MIKPEGLKSLRTSQRNSFEVYSISAGSRSGWQIQHNAPAACSANALHAGCKRIGCSGNRECGNRLTCVVEEEGNAHAPTSAPDWRSLEAAASTLRASHVPVCARLSYETVRVAVVIRLGIFLMTMRLIQLPALTARF